MKLMQTIAFSPEKQDESVIADFFNTNHIK